jgi:hypothetical protein
VQARYKMVFTFSVKTDSMFAVTIKHNKIISTRIKIFLFCVNVFASSLLYFEARLFMLRFRDNCKTAQNTNRDVKPKKVLFLYNNRSKTCSNKIKPFIQTF